MTRPISPYLVPGFYDDALAQGRHRDIVGGRWDETGRIQMQILREAGLLPHHRLLDIGAGSLRLGCKAVAYLDTGQYWATDQSRALMLRGHATELADPDRLPLAQLIEDADFAFPGLPDDIDFAIAFAVFTHLPHGHLAAALPRIRDRFPRLQRLLFTVFLAPDADALTRAHRQADGVVTHPDRAPWHMLAGDVFALATAAGFNPILRSDRLPRGQVLIDATPA